MTTNRLITFEGSSDFSGVRLTEARESVGLTVKTLASLLDVTRTTIHDYESDGKKPSPDKFARLCAVLNQPPLFFYSSSFEKEFTHKLVHYRDLKVNPLYSRAQAGVRLKWIMEYFSILEKELRLPKPNFPDLDPPADPALITSEYIENAAMEIRRLWGLGDKPIANLVNTLEKNGAVIGQTFLDLPNLDGLSFWSHKRDRPFILLNADKASCVRTRFDVAHELGHMVLHRNILEGIDKKSPIYRRTENQAHAFASALLLPKDSWLKDVRIPSLAAFKTLKPKWKVSIKAQIMRLGNLGMIDSDKKTSLLKQYSNHNWNANEPFDNLWELEKPKLFSQATKMLFEHGYNANVIAQVFPRRQENLSEIIGLPKSFFAVDEIRIGMKDGFLN